MTFWDHVPKDIFWVLGQLVEPDHQTDFQQKIAPWWCPNDGYRRIYAADWQKNIRGLINPLDLPTACRWAVCLTDIDYLQNQELGDLDLTLREELARLMVPRFPLPPLEGADQESLIQIFTNQLWPCQLLRMLFWQDHPFQDNSIYSCSSSPPVFQMMDRLMEIKRSDWFRVLVKLVVGRRNEVRAYLEKLCQQKQSEFFDAIMAHPKINFLSLDEYYQLGVRMICQGHPEFMQSILRYHTNRNQLIRQLVGRFEFDVSFPLWEAGIDYPRELILLTCTPAKQAYLISQYPQMDLTYYQLKQRQLAN